MAIRDHDEVLERHARRYESRTTVWSEIEVAAFGIAVGSNGYTVVEEAEELVRLVAQAVEGPVLDLGTGRGWPAKLVVEHGDRVLVATDVPVAGLRLAREAFETTGPRAKTFVAAADAGALPFSDGVFAAIVHADVFC